MRSVERRKANGLVMMKYNKSLVRVSRIDKVSNEVRNRAGIERELASIAGQKVLRWIGVHGENE